MISIRPLSRNEVRGIDDKAKNELGLPVLVLMENAGRGAATWLQQHASRNCSVLILCGPGNNGGDGAVMARHLNGWGLRTRVIWLAKEGQIRGDAALQHAVLKRASVDQEVWSNLPDLGVVQRQLAEPDWVIDGLLGTGLTRPVEGAYQTVIDALNNSGKPVLALDIPSGLDADTGKPQGTAVRAAATVTFVGPKLGFTRPGAEQYTGKIHVVDIGLPRVMLEPFLNTV